MNNTDHPVTDILQLDRLAKQFAAEPAFQLLQVRLLGLQDGVCETELTVTERHLQHRGAVQGGLIATLADATAGYAALTAAEPGTGEDVATIEFKTVFYKPAAAPSLFCRASVVRVGGGVVFCAATVGTGADDPEAFAAATLTFRRLRAPASISRHKEPSRDVA